MQDRITLKLRQIIHYLCHINLYFGKGVILRGVPKILYGNKIHFSKDVRINDDVFLHSAYGIWLGENVTLSYGSALITESYITENPAAYLAREHLGAPIHIGKNVWIGARAIVLSGVRIEDDIIVGAGAVVTKDLLEKGGIYAGNPARLIKKRELL